MTAGRRQLTVQHYRFCNGTDNCPCVPIETSRLAGLAIGALRKAQDAGQPTPVLPDEQLRALVDEFTAMQAAIANAWNQLADKLEAVPHHPTALTGPVWYGQGWDNAIGHIRDLADGMEPAPRRPGPKEKQQ